VSPQSLIASFDRNARFSQVADPAEAGRRGRNENVKEQFGMAHKVSEAIIAAIARVDQVFMEAFESGDAARAARGAYTRDAEIQPPGAPLITGREEIARFWAMAREQLAIRMVRLETVRLRAVGEQVHQLGTVTLTLADGQQATGKYAVLWAQEDGEWRWDVDTWNMDA
jgi:ketosteroid isomerase-like protein